VSAVTAFIAMLASAAMDRYDLGSLTKVYTGGAPTPSRVLTEWQRAPVAPAPDVRLTEATSPTHMTPYGAVPPVDPATGVTSIGVPVCNTDVRVVTECGQERRARRDRRAAHRGPADHSRLLEPARRDARLDSGGELRTGDIGSWTRKAGSTWSAGPRT
jgi:long-chain acyl-CoA synthetase